MDQVLIIREIVVKFFKKYQIFILTMCKFIFAFLLFNHMAEIGHVGEDFIRYTKPPLALPFNLIFCIIFTIFPISAGYLLIIAYAAFQLSGILEIAVIVTLFLLLLMFFYVRLDPDRAFLILATIIGFYFNVPYLVPIIAGLYLGLASIIPITIGIFIWESFIPLVKTQLDAFNLGSFKTAGTDFMALPVSFSDLYVSIMSYVKVNNYWIFWAFIFTMIIILVYTIARLSMDYAKELAIALGAVLNVLSFIMLVIVTDLDVNVFHVFIFTLLSALAAYLVRFFDCILDYSRAESVQFEDEDNYYYVKVIPKISLTKKKRVVKRIRPENE